jgi:hypothetical protein
LFELVISNLCTMSKQFKISFTIVFKFQCLPGECLRRIIYICLPLGVDDVSWESWWLVTTAIYDEGDGLILLNDTRSCCVSLGFAGTENTKTCKLLLWIVFSNLMDIFWWLKMHSINVMATRVLKGYYQGVGGPNCYPLYRSLYAFGLDACLYRSKLKLNEVLSQSGCSLLEYNVDFLTSYVWWESQHHHWVFLLLPEMRQKLRM